MTDWTSLLKEVIPSPCYYRPFVCRNPKNGFPDSHDVLTVGEARATNFHKDWWDFWTPELGFDYSHFHVEYLNARPDGKPSKTRRALDHFYSNGVAAVETNASNGDGVWDSNANVVKILLENMPNLKAVVVHGRTAQDFITRFQVIIPVKVYKTRHLRFVSYDKINSICTEINLQRDGKNYHGQLNGAHAWFGT